MRLTPLLALQLASNLAWNICFFKLRNPSLALKCASLFLGLLCATTITFHWILPSSAVLLLPVLGWAVLLFSWNHSVWRNNRVGTPNATLRTLVQKVQQRQADMGESVAAVSACTVWHQLWHGTVSVSTVWRLVVAFQHAL